LRRVPIRLKLAAALSIPLLALAVVTVLEVVKSVDDVSDVREQTDLAVSATGPSGLITALQNERTWPGVDLVGYAGAVTVMVEGYEQTRADTDEAIRQFRDLVTAKGGAIEAAYGPVLDQLDQLGPLRAEIDANVAANPTRTIENNGDFSQHVFETYTGLIEPIFDATTRISLAINDPELRQGTELADAAARQIEVLSQLASAVIRDVTNPDGTGLDTAAEVTRASTYESAFVRNADTMRNATGVYADIAATTFPTQLTDDVVAAVDTAITEGTVDINTLLEALNIPQEESYGAYQQAVADQIDERGDSLRDAARNRQIWFLALAFIVLGTAIALTWLVSRSITKPLRSLTRQAKEMAERRLPDAVIDILETPLGDDVQVPTVDPVVVHTRDEVADVSTALNTVQDTALDLAVEQAVLRRNIADSFVNLGRRNQNLLGRQLDFITELETNETDPDTLANLFRLDHLATRMRRNAESLLVLAGIEPPRKWAAPVRLTDVIRAALGEVEDYQRVTVRGVEPATIIGSAAADLAHLLAELIENALVFSPPDQTVDIRGRTRPDGYTLAVIDSGLGMPQADIAAANRRLAGAESFTIAPSKYLGHYVAGNLAARHNIHVTLDTGAHGITATIDLPPTLLTDERDLAPEVTPPHGHRPVLPAPPGPLAPAAPAAPEPPPAPLAGRGPAVAGNGGPTTRTHSGLVKRNARDVAASTVGADHPSGDLLDSLSRHTSNLQGRGPLPSPAPGAPWGSPPAANPDHRQPPPVPLPQRRPAPDARIAPLPPVPMPPAPARPATLPPTGPSPAPDSAGTTSGGLTRRVRGAQMPATQPVSLRRTGGDDRPPVTRPPATRPPAEPAPLQGLRRGVGPPPTPPVSPRPGPQPPPSVAPLPGVGGDGSAESRQRADDVYSFLSSFTAGVRRGLDANTHPQPEREADDPS
jgi:signal transduction histidine kinase